MEAAAFVFPWDDFPIAVAEIVVVLLTAADGVGTGAGVAPS